MLRALGSDAFSENASLPSSRISSHRVDRGGHIRIGSAVDIIAIAAQVGHAG